MKPYKIALGLALLSGMTAIWQPVSAAALKAKTAVLLHGAFADGSSWEKVIPHLKRRGSR